MGDNKRTVDKRSPNNVKFVKQRFNDLDLRLQSGY